MIGRTVSISVIVSTLLMLSPSASPSDWTIVSQREVLLEELKGVPRSLSPDGRWLLVVSQKDQRLCIWQIESLSLRGCLEFQIERSFFWVSELQIPWSPDSRFVAFATLDERLWLLDVEAWKVQELALPVKGQPLYPAFSPDGRRLAVGVEHGGSVSLLVLSLEEGLPSAAIAQPEGIFRGLLWADEARLIYGLVLPDQNVFSLWQVALSGGEPKLLWSYPFQSLRLISLSPDGRFAWIGLGLVDLKQGEWLYIREKHDVNSFAFSPDGSWWLYTSSQLASDLQRTFVLALRRAGTPLEQEQILLEEEFGPLLILGWAKNHLIAVLVPSSEFKLMLLKLESQQ